MGRELPDSPVKASLSIPKSEFLGLDLTGEDVVRVALVLLRPEPPGALVGAFVSCRFGFVLASGSGEGAGEESGETSSGAGSFTAAGSGCGSGLGSDLGFGVDFFGGSGSGGGSLAVSLTGPGFDTGDGVGFSLMGSFAGSGVTGNFSLDTVLSAVSGLLIVEDDTLRFSVRDERR